MTEETQASPAPLEIGQPVSGFPMTYTYRTDGWMKIFDAQVELIRRDIHRARANGKLIIYLSCPISARGGGYHGTNIDIANFTEQRLLTEWGERFWILNPTRYQLESKEGTGLLEQHAMELGLSLDALRKAGDPGGGDYMRMWTKVLVEDGGQQPPPAKPNEQISGRNFDAFYFLGPADVHEFFDKKGPSLTVGIETYIARKLAIDNDFDQFVKSGDPQQVLTDFFRFYALRASVTYSYGSHDEWLIFITLNTIRRAMGDGPTNQIAGFFDGHALDPAATETAVSRGYSL